MKKLILSLAVIGLALSPAFAAEKSEDCSDKKSCCPGSSESGEKKAEDKKESGESKPADQKPAE